MSSPYSEPAPASGAPGGKTSFMGLDSNVGAMLCYIANFICCLGLVLAIVFLFTEKENRFVKFHAVQSLISRGATNCRRHVIVQSSRPDAIARAEYA